MCFFCYALAFGACKKERLANQAWDPCGKMQPFELSIVADEFPGDSITVDTDSIFINRPITLRAVYPINGYFPKFEWQIGGMERKPTEGEVFLIMQTPNVQVGDEINITLTVEVPPSECNKEYQGSTTLKRTATKKLKIIAWKDAAIIGKYKGLFERDGTRKDTQVVEVRYFPPDNIYTDGHFAVFNVQKGCNQTVTNPNNSYWYDISAGSFTASKSMAFFAPDAFYNGCLGPSAWLKLSPTNQDSLIVDYCYSPSDSHPEVRLKDKFMGRRIF